MAILELVFGYWSGMAVALPVVLVLSLFVSAWGRK